MTKTASIRTYFGWRWTRSRAKGAAVFASLGGVQVLSAHSVPHRDGYNLVLKTISAWTASVFLDAMIEGIISGAGSGGAISRATHIFTGD
jgi:hypothetical protein